MNRPFLMYSHFFDELTVFWWIKIFDELIPPQNNLSNFFEIAFPNCLYKNKFSFSKIFTLSFFSFGFDEFGNSTKFRFFLNFFEQLPADEITFPRVTLPTNGVCSLLYCWFKLSAKSLDFTSFRIKLWTIVALKNLLLTDRLTV